MASSQSSEKKTPPKRERQQENIRENARNRKKKNLIREGGQLRTIKIEEEKLTLSNTPKAELSSIKRIYRRKNLT